MEVTAIARVAHEANRAYCQSIGDLSQSSWEDSPQWQRDSGVAGVQFALDNPDVGPEQQHDQWSADKIAHGWKYGPVKNAERKEHPCLVPYDQLPVEQQGKDALFRAVVKALAGLEIKESASV
jgi:hypothetical protein